MSDLEPFSFQLKLDGGARLPISFPISVHY